MKYTVSQAAQIVGATRQTIYRHIDSKPISVVKDENGNQLIDASELIRVYGNDINFDALDDDDTAPVTRKKLQDVTSSDRADSLEDKIRIVQLEAELSAVREILKKTEEENGYVKELLEEEKTERRKANNLLEDMRQKEGRAEAWDKTIRAMEQRISNQEKTAKEWEEKEIRLKKQNVALKRALAAEREERNKPLWKRIFGGAGE